MMGDSWNEPLRVAGGRDIFSDPSPRAFSRKGGIFGIRRAGLQLAGGERCW